MTLELFGKEEKGGVTYTRPLSMQLCLWPKIELFGRCEALLDNFS